MPEKRVAVYYSPHGLEFLATVRNLLDQMDILVQEAAQQLPDSYEIDFDMLCNGKLSPKAMKAKYPSSDAVMIALYGLLHKTRKRMVFEKSPVTSSDIKEIMRLDDDAISCVTRDVREATILKRRALQKFAESNNRRDAALADLVRDITNTNCQSRVMVWRGLAHIRGFGRELNARGVSETPIVTPSCTLGPLSGLAEKIANGEQISDSEIASVLHERIFPPWYVP